MTRENEVQPGGEYTRDRVAQPGNVNMQKEVCAKVSKQ